MESYYKPVIWLVFLPNAKSLCLIGLTCFCVTTGKGFCNNYLSVPTRKTAHLSIPQSSNLQCTLCISNRSAIPRKIRGPAWVKLIYAGQTVIRHTDPRFRESTIEKYNKHNLHIGVLSFIELELRHALESKSKIFTVSTQQGKMRLLFVIIIHKTKQTILICTL